uniref:Putative secreted salivary gland peptide n=1 Tax=Amblyomma aureolatum TaxID=187763 RepID=A0A1E1WYR9_9ACAR
MNGSTTLLAVALLAAAACWAQAVDPKAKAATPASAAESDEGEGVEGRILGLGKLRGALRQRHQKRPSLIGALLGGHKHRGGGQLPLGGAHYGHAQGGQQHGYQQAAQGFNQGSQAFEGQDKYKNVQGFRETKGYRTEMGFEETSFNRYGSGTGAFQGGFNQHEAGKFQQHGQQQSGFVAAPVPHGGR